MTPDTLLPLAGFAIAATVTPGPNNVMLMASGANFGVRRTLPHMAGISVGVAALVFLSGLGLGQVIAAAPAIRATMTTAAICFLLYLAWKIATAAPASGSGATAARPLTFLQAAGFQWINPKAWAMAVSVATVYIPDATPSAMLLAALIFFLVAIPSTSLWTAAGERLSHWLSDPRRLRLFNLAMAGLLILTLVPMLRG